MREHIPQSSQTNQESKQEETTSNNNITTNNMNNSNLPSNNIIKETEQGTVSQGSSSNGNPNQVSDNEKSMQFELEYLRKQRDELLEQIEKQKLELKVSEERFIKSKPFQLLMSQAESIMQQLYSLKETNINLIKQKVDLEISKDNEIKIIEANLTEKKVEAEKKYLEVLKLYEEAKMTINILSVKIEIL